MNVLILHQSIVKHDAIGNDICQMYTVLNRIGETFVYCEKLNVESLKTLDRQQLSSFMSNKSNLIVYHHSQFWEEGENILRNAKAKIVFKYHNITPAHFYEGYSDDAYRKCMKGKEQTQHLIHKHADSPWLGDSSFNLRDIDSVRPDLKAVVPPFNNVGTWSIIVPDNKQLKELLESKNINLLFVGRVVPNKGHKFLFRIIKDYIDHYGSDIQLTMLGNKDDSCGHYWAELDKMIKRLDLKKNVHFAGTVNENIMLAYYLGSDFFLCGSEHEGFCIPLVEAQFCHLPVIARRTSAVEETLGYGQLLLREDVREYSSALKVLSDSRAYKDAIIKQGYDNYRQRFTNDKISALFKNALNKMAGVTL